jgi:hypothetical protein
LTRVNRERKLRIVYRINARGPDAVVLEDEPVYWSMQDGLEAEAGSGGAEEVSRDELLATVIALIRGREIAVRDTIDHTANVVGAMHPVPQSQRSVRLQSCCKRCRADYGLADTALIFERFKLWAVSY